MSQRVCPCKCAESLGAIFDQIEVELSADVDQFVHVTWTAVQMNDHQRLGARCDLPADVFRVDLPRCSERLHENRRCSGLNNGVDRSNVGECWNDYLPSVSSARCRAAVPLQTLVT